MLSRYKFKLRIQNVDVLVYLRAECRRLQVFGFAYRVILDELPRLICRFFIQTAARGNQNRIANKVFVFNNLRTALVILSLNGYQLLAQASRHESAGDLDVHKREKRKLTLCIVLFSKANVFFVKKHLVVASRYPAPVRKFRGWKFPIFMYHCRIFQLLICNAVSSRCECQYFRFVQV